MVWGSPPCFVREETVARPAAAATFGRAKACILLFMWGGPAQQETWDLKPEAPEQVRGEFRPIATNVPGMMISEHFPLLATQAHRLAVIRSVHHADVNHLTATHALLTGRPGPRNDGAPLAEDWPHIGAVLARLNRGRERSSLPPFVQMRPDGSRRRAAVRGREPRPGGWLAWARSGTRSRSTMTRTRRVSARGGVAACACLTTLPPAGSTTAVGSCRSSTQQARGPRPSAASRRRWTPTTTAPARC